MSALNRIDENINSAPAGLEEVSTVGQPAEVPPLIILGSPSPRRQTLSWFKSSGRVCISVTNFDASQVPLHLTMAVEGPACRYVWYRPGHEIVSTDQLDLQLPPGDTTPVTITITPVQRSLIKPERQSYTCRIRAQLSNQPEPSHLVTAQVLVEPLLNPGWLTLLVGLILLLGLALASWFSHPTSSANPHQTRRFIPIENEVPVPAQIGSMIGEAPPVRPTPDQLSLEVIFKDAAAQYDLNWRILVEQAYWESRLDPWAVGAHQEAGLMQIFPTTWQEWSQKVGVTDPFDPYSNILVSAAYMAFLRDHFESIGYPDERWMLAAYNWGPVNLHQLLETGGGWQDIPEETRQYSLTILNAAQADQIRPEIGEVLQQSASTAFNQD